IPTDRLMAALGTGELPELLERIEIAPGDCLDVPAGTLHAIGPGAFVYEIQQPSDITYRVWDWGRTDRTIHIEQTRRVTDPQARGSIHRVPVAEHAAIVASSPFFTARQLLLGGRSLPDTTDGRSPHVVTLLEGAAELVTDHGALRMAAYDTVVVPAGHGAYR